MPDAPQPVVLVADEVGHVIAALKAPGEMPARFCQLQFFDSLRLAARSLNESAPSVAVIAQRRLPNGTGLETAGDLWRADGRLLIILVTDSEAVVDPEDWRREFGATDRVQLLPWSGRTLELETAIRSLLTRRTLEDRACAHSAEATEAVRTGFPDVQAMTIHLATELLDQASDSIYFKDRESRYARCSRSLAERLGLEDPGKIINKSDFDFFSEEYALATFADDQQVIRTGDPLFDRKERQV